LSRLLSIGTRLYYYARWLVPAKVKQASCGRHITAHVRFYSCEQQWFHSRRLCPVFKSYSYIWLFCLNSWKWIFFAWKVYFLFMRKNPNLLIIHKDWYFEQGKQRPETCTDRHHHQPSINLLSPRKIQENVNAPKIRLNGQASLSLFPLSIFLSKRTCDAYDSLVTLTFHGYNVISTCPISKILIYNTGRPKEWLRGMLLAVLILSVSAIQKEKLFTSSWIFRTTCQVD
jgi:hypothetical protein